MNQEPIVTAVQRPILGYFNAVLDSEHGAGNVTVWSQCDVTGRFCGPGPLGIRW